MIRWPGWVPSLFCFPEIYESVELAEVIKLSTEMGEKQKGRRNTQGSEVRREEGTYRSWHLVKNPTMV